MQILWSIIDICVNKTKLELQVDLNHWSKNWKLNFKCAKLLKSYIKKYLKINNILCSNLFTKYEYDQMKKMKSKTSKMIKKSKTNRWCVSVKLYVPFYVYVLGSFSFYKKQRINELK